MKEYRVDVWETVRHMVSVEAETEHEAHTLAMAEIEGGYIDTIYDREYTGYVVDGEDNK